MAETTTTTSWPGRRVATMWSATALMRSGSATDVPPNFWTTRPTASTVPAGRSGSGTFARRRRSGAHRSVESAPVSKAAKRERQRQNREARREFEEQVDQAAPAHAVAPELRVPARSRVIILGARRSRISATAAATRAASVPARRVVRSYHEPRRRRRSTRPRPTPRRWRRRCGTIDDRPRRRERTDVGQQLRLPRERTASTTARSSSGPRRTSSSRPAAPTTAQGRGPGYTVQAEVPEDAVPGRARSPGEDGADPTGRSGSQFFIVTGPGRRDAAADYGRSSAR